MEMSNANEGISVCIEKVPAVIRDESLFFNIKNSFLQPVTAEAS